MMKDIKNNDLNELNEQEMENVSGGASVDRVFDAVTDTVGDVWDAGVGEVADTAWKVVKHVLEDIF